MTWIIAIALALAIFLIAAFLLKAPRSGWEAIAAALLFGIAGYGVQVTPGLPGAPKAATQKIESDPAAMVDARSSLSERGIPPSNQWVVIADGMARNGQFANAAQVLLGAVEDNPKNAEAWLAMGNALVAHADGSLTPAALYAFRKSEEADPDSPGPPFFLGMALAQSGKFDEAKQIWTGLLGRSAPDAPWREDLAGRLEVLNKLIAAQSEAHSLQQTGQ